MKKQGLLMAARTGRWQPRAQKGQGCDVPIEHALVLGRPRVHVLEQGSSSDDLRARLLRSNVIGWTATTAAISGELIRDMMIECVERRFGSVRTPHRVKWITENGSVYAAAKTVEIAKALGLTHCFTPLGSPESNGMAEAFIKTFKRDYVRVNPLPNASVAPAAIEGWMDDYNHVHPHSRLGYLSPRGYIRANLQPAACPI